MLEWFECEATFVVVMHMAGGDLLKYFFAHFFFPRVGAGRTDYTNPVVVVIIRMICHYQSMYCLFQEFTTWYHSVFSKTMSYLLWQATDIVFQRVPTQ